MAAQQVLLRVCMAATLVLVLSVSCSDNDPVSPPPPSPSFEWMPVVTGEGSFALWGTPDGSLLGFGPEGGVLHIREGTSEFKPSGTEARLVDAWGASSKDIFAVGHTHGGAGG